MIVPRLKPRQLPQEFIDLSVQMTEAKIHYDELMIEYRTAVDALAREGWNTSYISSISPFAYPTLRNWMIKATNGSVDDTGH